MKLPKFKIVEVQMPWGLDGDIELLGINEDQYQRITPPKWLKKLIHFCYQAGRDSLKQDLKMSLGIKD